MLATVAVLAVAVFTIYGRALEAPFIFDDRPGIVDNPSIRRLWPPIGDATIRGPLNPPPLAPTARRPLPNLTFALNYRVGGLDPWSYRLVNVLLHVLTAALMAAVVRRTLRLRYAPDVGERAAWGLALAVALLWAVHPLVTEAVAYVIQRTELLAACCCLATLWAAQRYWTTDSAGARRAWLVVAGLASLAGMASKEFVAALPLIVLLYERTFLADGWRTVWRRSRSLHLMLALGWILIVLLNAGDISGMSDARHRIPLHVWWITQAKTLLLYLKLAVWPWPLSIHYAPLYLRTLDTAWPWLAAATALAFATLVLAWRRPAAGFVIAAVALILAPTFIVPVPKMVAAERRMYLPLAGLVALAIVGGYRSLSAHWPRLSGRAYVSAAAALILIAGAVSVTRLAAYESAVSIWQDATVHQPDDPMAHYNLGVALMDDGRPPEDAMTQFEEALRLDPEHTGALDNLGIVLHRLGREQDALSRFEQALRIDADDAVAHNNIGAILTSAGRPSEAIGHLRLALALQPDSPKAKTHLNLGQALLGTTDHADEAVVHLEEAVRLAPDDADTQYTLGAALLRFGRPEDAIPHFERALRLNPNDAEVHKDFGTALLAVGRTPEAIDELEHALRSKPDQPTAHYNLAIALQHAGRPREAIPHLEEALAMARSRGETALAGEIEARLAEQQRPPAP